MEIPQQLYSMGNYHLTLVRLYFRYVIFINKHGICDFNVRKYDTKLFEF